MELVFYLIKKLVLTNAVSGRGTGDVEISFKARISMMPN